MPFENTKGDKIMIRLSKRSQKELLLCQLEVQDQLKDLEEFEEVETEILDDSMANFIYTLLHGSEEEILNLVTYTRAKYKQMMGENLHL